MCVRSVCGVRGGVSCLFVREKHICYYIDSMGLFLHLWVHCASEAQEYMVGVLLDTEGKTYVTAYSCSKTETGRPAAVLISRRGVCVRAVLVRAEGSAIYLYGNACCYVDPVRCCFSTRGYIAHRTIGIYRVDIDTD